jgi:hypothetical protein
MSAGQGLDSLPAEKGQTMQTTIYGDHAEDSYSKRKSLCDAYLAMLLPLPLQLNCRLVFNDAQPRNRADHLVSMFLERLQGRVADELVWALGVNPRLTYVTDVYLMCGLRGGACLPRVHVDKSWKAVSHTFCTVEPVRNLRSELRAFLKRCGGEPRVFSIDRPGVQRSA